MPQDTVTINDIFRARNRIQNYVKKTPCYPSVYYGEKSGTKVWLKLECYQPTGVFKIRGAFNAVLENYERLKDTGVVTASSGNHGFSVAYAARALNVKATVVITDNANPDKVKLIRRYGAEIVTGGMTSDSIISKAKEVSKERNLFFIHPFDDPSVIAGQGTVGLELFEEIPELDTVIVPVGGGGLIAGVSIAARALSDHCNVIGVEAEGVPSLYEALKKGELVTIRNPRTIADGLIGQTTGKLNFEICKNTVSEVLLVSDYQMEEATKSLLAEAHILAEPSGTAPLAALQNKYSPKKNEKIALVISGGNISYQSLQQLLRA